MGDTQKRLACPLQAEAGGLLRLLSAPGMESLQAIPQGTYFTQQLGVK